MADTDKPDTAKTAEKDADKGDKPGPEVANPTAAKGETAPEAAKLERRTAQDFETGGDYEEPYLSGGVRADAALRAREETAHKMRVETGLEAPDDAGGDKGSADKADKGSDKN
jgi:hypothetical protein